MVSLGSVFVFFGFSMVSFGFLYAHIWFFWFYYGFPWFSIGFYRFCKESGQVSLLWASPSSISSSLTRNKEIWSSLASSGPLLPLSLSLRVMEGIERKEWPTPSPKRLRKAKKNNRLGAFLSSGAPGDHWTCSGHLLPPYFSSYV